MNLKELIAKYLSDHGFEGLVSEKHECWCETSSLLGCGQPDENSCETAFKHKDGTLRPYVEDGDH